MKGHVGMQTLKYIMDIQINHGGSTKYKLSRGTRTYCWPIVAELGKGLPGLEIKKSFLSVFALWSLNTTIFEVQS